MNSTSCRTCRRSPWRNITNTYLTSTRRLVGDFEAMYAAEDDEGSVAEVLWSDTSKPSFTMVLHWIGPTFLPGWRARFADDRIEKSQNYDQPVTALMQPAGYGVVPLSSRGAPRSIPAPARLAWQPRVAEAVWLGVARRWRACPLLARRLHPSGYAPTMQRPGRSITGRAASPTVTSQPKPTPSDTYGSKSSGGKSRFYLHDQRVLDLRTATAFSIAAVVWVGTWPSCAAFPASPVKAFDYSAQAIAVLRAGLWAIRSSRRTRQHTRTRPISPPTRAAQWTMYSSPTS